MNREDRGKIVGMVLGDGHIRTALAADKLAGRRIAAQMSFSHSTKQEEYAAYKLSVLNNIFGGKATLRKGQFKGYHFVYANKSNPYFKTLKGMMYPNGKKLISRRVLDMLTPEGIAFWFMDDGSYSYRRREDGTISSVVLTITMNRTREEVDEIVKYFDEAHNIHFKVAYYKRLDGWYVRLNSGESKKFENLIAPHIHQSMKYKIAPISDRHECPRPDLSCASCGKIVKRLSGQARCNACYLRTWNAAKRAMI